MVESLLFSFYISNDLLYLEGEMTAVRIKDIPTQKQIEDAMLESMRNAGAIGTDFLIGKQKVNIEMRDIRNFAERIYLRINGKKSWQCPEVDKLREWLKE